MIDNLRIAEILDTFPEVVEKGRNACLRGTPVRFCPYEVITPKAWAWLYGYQLAERGVRDVR